MRLKGKIALVTGASRGIGRAIAESLGQEGATVIVNYNSNTDAANEVVETLFSFGAEAIPIKADIADRTAVESMFGIISERYGGLDILVNNAGVWRGGKLNKIAPADWEYVLNTNLQGIFVCTQAALKSMLERGGGKIINISSVIGLTGFPGDTIYGTSKSGIFGFTKSLAKEVAKHRIHVNAVAPGFIATDMNSELDEKTKAGLNSRIPFGYLGKPEDVAEVVCFLAYGGAYVTGQVWAVDGGYTMVS